MDLEAADVSDERGVSGAQVVAMGKVAWDKNQVNRSISVKLRNTYDEIEIFRAAWAHLGGSRTLRMENGDAFVVPESSVPELVAANLGADRHWCAGFVELVKEKKDFLNCLFRNKGFVAMKKTIQDHTDQTVIDAFHDAWHQTMGALGERAKRDNLEFDRLAEVERERMRNAILRAKTSEALANWFLRFCADATSGGSLLTIRDHRATLQAFLFDERNAGRLQNLLLFSLVSYSSEHVTERKSALASTRNSNN
jgi:CRISPR-associated protein Cas8a1/Csx13